MAYRADNGAYEDAVRALVDVYPEASLSMVVVDFGLKLKSGSFYTPHDMASHMGAPSNVLALLQPPDWLATRRGSSRFRR